MSNPSQERTRPEAGRLFSAIRHILAQGDYPSIKNVRAKVGSGTDRDIAVFIVVYLIRMELEKEGRRLQSNTKLSLSRIVPLWAESLQNLAEKQERIDKNHALTLSKALAQIQMADRRTAEVSALRDRHISESSKYKHNAKKLTNELRQIQEKLDQMDIEQQLLKDELITSNSENRRLKRQLETVNAELKTEREERDFLLEFARRRKALHTTTQPNRELETTYLSLQSAERNTRKVPQPTPKVERSCDQTGVFPTIEEQLQRVPSIHNGTNAITGWEIE